MVLGRLSIWRETGDVVLGFFFFLVFRYDTISMSFANVEVREIDTGASKQPATLV